MFECANLGCTCRVSHRGQLCGMCQEQIVDDFDYEDDFSGAEHLCVKCGERDAIVNDVCGMCSELHPNMV
jgi:hypothetical protein